MSDEGLQEEWRREYQKLYGDRECSLSSASGIPLKPVYTPEDTAGQDPRDIGMPGVFPYTRGTFPLLYQLSPWTTQQGLGYGLPEHTRERFDLLYREGLQAGQGMVPQFFIVPDAVCQPGYDPDHPAARGQVGVCGTSWCSVRDMEILFRDLPLDQIGVVFATYDSSVAALAMYVAAAERLGFQPKQLRGHTVNNIYRQTCWDLPSFPPESALKVCAEFIKYTSRNIPRWSPISFQGYGYQEAGANAVQELAFMLAPAIAVTESCIQGGLSPDDFVSRYGFHIALDDDFFESVAKSRALRRMWAKLAAERFGCREARSLKAIIQAETAGSSLTAQQPLNNVIRAALQTLAGVMGGATSIWTTHYDEGLGLPTEEAAVLCLRTQQIIYHETGVPQVTDPLGGGYYIEWLTDRLEGEANRLLTEIEQRGFISCWRSGWFRRELERTAYQERQRLDQGERVKVGVNRYTSETPVQVPTFRVDPEVEKVAAARVKSYREERDQGRAQASLREMREVAERVHRDFPSGGDLMPAVVEAARAEATLGEIMGVLKEVFGWGYVY
jgi:methylmalonyl-CoA mutase N-terminal domain/subunit